MWNNIEEQLHQLQGYDERRGQPTIESSVDALGITTAARLWIDRLQDIIQILRATIR
jgi:hypothetical protein